MARIRPLFAATLIALGPNIALAECVAPEFQAAAPAFAGTPPQPPAEASRPVPPECLRDLSGPEQENCSPEQVAAYSAEVATYLAALNGYIAEADQFANATVAFANAAIAHAEGARAFADEAFAFANCEAAAVRNTE